MKRESKYVGAYNIFIQITFKLGIVFFILREVIFFFSFFWTYFHFIFLFNGEFGFRWPPVNISSIDYMSIPLLNTLLLLRRGLSLTLAHNYFLLNNKFNILIYLIVTVILGLIFIVFQLIEYHIIEFLWSEASYGSIFFIGTSFHGFHVILGLSILIYLSLSARFNLINSKRTNFDLIAWYWHFVDIVWIILFTEFYWWENFLS